MAVSKKPRRSKPTTRAEFAALERLSWGELKQTWHALPDEALVRPGACGPWSIKDVMNHVLKSRAGTWVKYATYGHYDKHLAGLQEYRGKLGMR